MVYNTINIYQDKKSEAKSTKKVTKRFGALDFILYISYEFKNY
tara:strand:- start:791 stop:919 length:129 start_codon:yes stop_codon:yes gene_type:complete